MAHSIDFMNICATVAFALAAAPMLYIWARELVTGK